MANIGADKEQALDEIQEKEPKKNASVLEKGRNAFFLTIMAGIFGHCHAGLQLNPQEFEADEEQAFYFEHQIVSKWHFT